MQRSHEEKAIKSFVVLGVTNLVVEGLGYLSQTNLGLIGSLALNGVLLYSMHELGRRRRPGANLRTRAGSFFASVIDAPSSDLENAFRNIINGGAAMYDEVAEACENRP